MVWLWSCGRGGVVVSGVIVRVWSWCSGGNSGLKCGDVL